MVSRILIFSKWKEILFSELNIFFQSIHCENKDHPLDISFSLMILNSSERSLLTLIFLIRQVRCIHQSNGEKSQ